MFGIVHKTKCWSKEKKMNSRQIIHNKLIFGLTFAAWDRVTILQTVSFVGVYIVDRNSTWASTTSPLSRSLLRTTTAKPNILLGSNWQGIQSRGTVLEAEAGSQQFTGAINIQTVFVQSHPQSIDWHKVTAHIPGIILSLSLEHT